MCACVRACVHVCLYVYEVALRCVICTKDMFNRSCCLDRKAKCLNKIRPVTTSDDRLPGEIYNASQQCQMLRLDGAARVCPYHWAKEV